MHLEDCRTMHGAQATQEINVVSFAAVLLWPHRPHPCNF